MRRPTTLGQVAGASALLRSRLVEAPERGLKTMGWAGVAFVIQPVPHKSCTPYSAVFVDAGRMCGYNHASLRASIPVTG